MFLLCFVSHLSHFSNFHEPSVTHTVSKLLSFIQLKTDLFIYLRRPFARKLPEFKFWCSCIQAVMIAFYMTFFTSLDIPVFWPALLIYFLALFFIQMKTQIKHMIKHRYVPFSWGKTKYATGGAISKGSGKQNL